MDSLRHAFVESSCNANGQIWQATDVCVGLIDHLEMFLRKVGRIRFHAPNDLDPAIAIDIIEPTV